MQTWQHQSNELSKLLIKITNNRDTTAKVVLQPADIVEGNLDKSKLFKKLSQHRITQTFKHTKSQNTEIHKQKQHQNNCTPTKIL